MKKEINARETSRAAAFELWISSPMPMVTLTKTFDVSRIMKISRKRGWKFNMILCWAIGCAASRTKEFIFFRKKNLLKEFLMRKNPKKKNLVHPGD